MIVRALAALLLCLPAFAQERPANRKRDKLRFKLEEGVQALSYSPDGKILAIVTRDGRLTLRDPVTGAERPAWKAHRKQTFSLAFVPDGTRWVTREGHGFVRIRNLSDGNVLWERQMTNLLEDVLGRVAISGDGTRVAVGTSKGTIHLLEAKDGTELQVLRGHKGHVFSVSFSPDGRLLASAGYGDRTVRLWSLREGAELRRFDGEPEQLQPATIVAFSPDGKRLAWGAGSRWLRIWDVAEWKEIAAVRSTGQETAALVFSPDGSRIATSGIIDVEPVLRNGSTGQYLAVLRPGHDESVLALAFAPDGRTLASGADDGSVIVWDVSP